MVNPVTYHCQKQLYPRINIFQLKVRTIITCMTRILSILTVLTLFGFQSATASHFNFVNAESGRVDDMRLVLEMASLKLARLLEVELPDTITIVIVETQEEFDSVARGKIPEWGAGAAIPTRDLIVLRRPMMHNYPGNMSDLLQHELAHIAMHHCLKGARAPRFIDEGFASWFAGEWSFTRVTTIAAAQFTKSLLPLRQIDRVGSFQSGKANLAYAQSYLVIIFIFERFGEIAFLELLDAFAHGAKLEEAFREAFGIPFWQFEVEYRKYLSDKYTFYNILSDTMKLWIILAILVIIGFILVKKRKKDAIERWKEEEKLESTDFDYEESSPWD